MSDPAPRRRLRLPRFSLRSLILLIVVISSGTGLWYRWEPWATIGRIPGALNQSQVNRNGDYSSALAPDGHHYAQYLLSPEETVIWDLHSVRKISALQDGGPQIDYIEPSFSPDSRRVAASSAKGTVCIWDVQSGKKLTSLQKSSGVTGVWFLSDGKYVMGKDLRVTKQKDNEAVILWDALTLQRYKNPVHFLRFET